MFFHLRIAEHSKFAFTSLADHPDLYLRCPEVFAQHILQSADGCLHRLVKAEARVALALLFQKVLRFLVLGPRARSLRTQFQGDCLTCISDVDRQCLGVYLIANAVACRIDLKELRPSFLINAYEHWNHSKRPHVGMLQIRQEVRMKGMPLLS